MMPPLCHVEQLDQLQTDLEENVGNLGEGGEAVNELRHGRLYNRCYYTDVHG